MDEDDPLYLVEQAWLGGWEGLCEQDPEFRDKPGMQEFFRTVFYSGAYTLRAAQKQAHDLFMKNPALGAMKLRALHNALDKWEAENTNETEH